jgi:tetratricopeptide (TPR) repeat protein
MIGLLLFAALLGAYYPALRGGFLWDDVDYISGNPALRTVAGLRAIWFHPSASFQYYPLSFTFFWAAYQLCGLNPLGFHLLTLLLHCLAAILFWQILLRLRVRGALLAAAIFALHPVNVMSVAYMNELKNTLSASLALGAAWAYLRFACLGVYDRVPDHTESPLPARAPWRWYALSLALFQLAMLAKTAVSFLPATLLLLLWWQRPRITARDLLSLLPMLGISVAMGAFTIHVERHAGGASGAEFTLGFLDRVLVSGRSFWFYLSKLLWPARLAFVYEHWKLDPADWRQWLYPVATVALISGAWITRRRIGRGPFVALMHFYISTSLLILAVVLYRMRYSFVADHWQYFGSLGIIALVASALARAMDRFGPRGRPLGIALGLGLVFALGVMTWAQSAIYSDSETLWRDTIARTPDSWMAYTNLGLALLQHGRPQEAAAQYIEALRINPGDAQTHNNLGNAFFRQGLIDQAIAQYRQAFQIDPPYAEAHNNLGAALLRQGRAEDAIVQYRQAIGIDPAYADAHQNLGIALSQQGRTDAAIAEFHRALQLDPAFPDAHNHLGNALDQLGRTRDAIAQYREALRLDPSHVAAHYNLANDLFQQGQAAEAIAHARQALGLQPANPAIQNTLAWMLAAAPQPSLRDGARAVQLATLASQSSGGGNPVILRTLAAAYAQAGQFPIAVQAAQRALQLAEAQSNPTLTASLLREIKLYNAATPYRDGQ